MTPHAAAFHEHNKKRRATTPAGLQGMLVPTAAPGSIGRDVGYTAGQRIPFARP